MSNFQRTRSKVWWDSEDDRPTGYHPPRSQKTSTPKANNCEENNENKSNNDNYYQYNAQSSSSNKSHNNIEYNYVSVDDNQLLQKYLSENQMNNSSYFQKIDNVDQIDNNKSPDLRNNEILHEYLEKNQSKQNCSGDSPRPSPRLLRPASPASHRSQDSGFSDSDCSPTQQQAVQKTAKREENWQRVVESLKTSRSLEINSNSSPVASPRRIAPDLQKIQTTPLKNFMQTHDGEKFEPKIVDHVKKRPKLLSVHSCPEGRPNSVHRLIYKFDHGESPLPGYKSSDNGFKHFLATKENKKIEASTSPEIFRDTPKNHSRKIDYIDYSQMSYGPVTVLSDKNGYDADESKTTISPDFAEKIDQLNFDCISYQVPEDLHVTTLNLSGSPLLQHKSVHEDEKAFNENQANNSKLTSPKKRIDTFNQGAMDDTYFNKKRKNISNKSLPNPGTGNFKLNFSLSPEIKDNKDKIIAKSDSNNVTNVSVESYNSIDDYDANKEEPNNNSPADNICQIKCTNVPSKVLETEIKSLNFSTPPNLPKCYNNETVELLLPSKTKTLKNQSKETDAIPDGNLELNPSCTSTPKWYRPSEIKQVTPVSHRKINFHRRVNLLAGFNATPEDSAKESNDNDKLGIKIVDGKVWMKSNSTNTEIDRSDSKDIFEEPRSEEDNVQPQKINKKNIFEKMFTKKSNNEEQKLNNEPKVKDKQFFPKKPDCVKSWLRELTGSCEPEAMTALQNKAIRATSNISLKSKDKEVETVVQNINAVRRIAVQAAAVLDELENVQRSIYQNKPELCGPLLQSALGGVISFIKSNETTPSSKKILELCDAAKIKGKPTDEQTISTIAVGVRAHVEELCFRYLEVLTDVLEEPPSSQCLSAALSGLGALCSAYGGAMGYSAVKSGLVRALLIVCLNSHTYTLRQNSGNVIGQFTAPSSSLGKALRVLATLCQTEQSIRQFCQAGGVSVILDILEDKRCAEPERREAAAVLTQITGPWVTSDQELVNQKNQKDTNVKKWDWRQELNKHKIQLVRALTDFLSETKCCQTLLLCAAALANASLPRLSFPESLGQVTSPNGTTESLVWSEAVTELLKAVKRRGPGCSVFLQEQTSSLLCNLSAIQECRRRLCPWTKNTAVSVEPIMALFSFLNTCRRFLVPEDLSFRRGITRASERMDYSSSLLQSSVRAKTSDNTRSSTKSERLSRNFDSINSPSNNTLDKTTPAEKASAERMLISTTLCLTRFCRDREISRTCFKLGAHSYLLMAADLLRKQENGAKDVLEVCEEAMKIMADFNGRDVSVRAANESYV